MFESITFDFGRKIADIVLSYTLSCLMKSHLPQICEISKARIGHCSPSQKTEAKKGPSHCHQAAK